jgi:cation transport ATPase
MARRRRAEADARAPTNTTPSARTKVGASMAEDGERRMLRQALRVLAVPWLLGLSIGLGWLLGTYLDRRWKLDVPWATIALVTFAVLAGGYQSYRMIMRLLKDPGSEQESES